MYFPTPRNATRLRTLLQAGTILGAGIIVVAQGPSAALAQTLTFSDPSAPPLALR